MAHIVILGAGIGGMPAAYEVRQELGKEHKVTVVTADTYFQFIPSNPWVAVGWRNRDDITFPLAPYLERKGIDLISQRVDKIVPTENRLELANGETVTYDYLIITTGAKLMFSAIEGSGPHGGYTQSICTVDHAEHCYENFKQLLDKPGPVIVGAMPGASCYGPAYEYVFILDTALRKKKIRNKVPITFVTAEPYIGHLGLGGVGDSNGMLESELRAHDIKWITNAKTTKVEDGKMFVDELDRNGEVIKQHELPFNHSMMLPSFAGVDCVAGVTEMCNPKGFVKIDEYQRNPEYKNIFAAGVCVAIPPVEPTPVPVGAPKTGYMIESMVTAIVHNIKAELTGHGEPDSKGTWQAICLADFGDRGAAFIALPQIPPRNVNWFAAGKWVHLAKIAFEKYFIRKMKKGTSEPLYEKYMMRAIGINRLEK
ncbi:NAD(P)/FAD-dependent oxidoreductase [Halothiobacillus neapolitanus]|jgi:sulfide:quinone oxidoreductase|uniref:Sulfide-quinone reductase n=1 Tax=Halothiobacillus neapolitanus (strain ATCC 23641 / DSM 15147 / CIP 104769 / NCIMB 8539 / c2) TaxID=555778 RepID=D0KYC6_HALNC|nr:FAD-dependent oxidoreductase [Halothiobacillus neapolitanus]ACX95449.1 FAD-dependent pyridine nucleotide-disulphide oxidoreductase [Halothiobacillus neapolitanus c2]TDN65747.1 sulfide-quinone oxidoreductase [Halothiobacillus neapolitanus]